MRFKSTGGLLKLFVKWLFFPGLDLHTRCRYRFLPRFFTRGAIKTLDAGCGNGALSYAAYKLGNRVLGVTKNPAEVRKAQTLFSTLGIEHDGLSFSECDLYDLPQLNRRFDQIICSETLEHITNHELVIRHFYDLLNDSGILHLCCPYALHPEHNLGRVSAPEDGGHVRDGYTAESYRALLFPAGFEIVKVVGLGSPFLVKLDKLVRAMDHRFGHAFALPVFLLAWPLTYLDTLNPRVPHSLYVMAVKKPKIQTI